MVSSPRNQIKAANSTVGGFFFGKCRPKFFLAHEKKGWCHQIPLLSTLIRGVIEGPARPGFASNLVPIIFRNEPKLRALSLHSPQI